MTQINVLLYNGTRNRDFLGKGLDSYFMKNVWLP